MTWNEPGASAHLWRASSPNRDFRNATWTSEPIEGNGESVAKVEPPDEGWVAFYVEVRFASPNGVPYGLCTEMTVLPDRFPDEAPSANVEDEKH